MSDSPRRRHKRHKADRPVDVGVAAVALSSSSASAASAASVSLAAAEAAASLSVSMDCTAPPVDGRVADVAEDDDSARRSPLAQPTPSRTRPPALLSSPSGSPSLSQRRMRAQRERLLQQEREEEEDRQRRITQHSVDAAQPSLAPFASTPRASSSSAVGSAAPVASSVVRSFRFPTPRALPATPHAAAAAATPRPHLTSAAAHELASPFAFASGLGPLTRSAVAAAAAASSASISVGSPYSLAFATSPHVGAALSPSIFATTQAPHATVAGGPGSSSNRTAQRRWARQTKAVEAVSAVDARFMLAPPTAHASPAVAQPSPVTDPAVSSQTVAALPRSPHLAPVRARTIASLLLPDDAEELSTGAQAHPSLFSRSDASAGFVDPNSAVLPSSSPPLLGVSSLDDAAESGRGVSSSPVSLPSGHPPLRLSIQTEDDDEPRDILTAAAGVGGAADEPGDQGVAATSRRALGDDSHLFPPQQQQQQQQQQQHRSYFEGLFPPPDSTSHRALTHAHAMLPSVGSLLSSPLSSPARGLSAFHYVGVNTPRAISAAAAATSAAGVDSSVFAPPSPARFLDSTLPSLPSPGPRPSEPRVRASPALSSLRSAGVPLSDATVHHSSRRHQAAPLLHSPAVHMTNHALIAGTPLASSSFSFSPLSTRHANGRRALQQRHTALALSIPPTPTHGDTRHVALLASPANLNSTSGQELVSAVAASSAGASREAVTLRRQSPASSPSRRRSATQLEQLVEVDEHEEEDTQMHDTQRRVDSPIHTDRATAASAGLLLAPTAAALHASVGPVLAHVRVPPLSALPVPPHVVAMRRHRSTDAIVVSAPPSSEAADYTFVRGSPALIKLHERRTLTATSQPMPQPLLASHAHAYSRFPAPVASAGAQPSVCGPHASLRTSRVDSAAVVAVAATTALGALGAPTPLDAITLQAASSNHEHGLHALPTASVVAATPVLATATASASVVAVPASTPTPAALPVPALPSSSSMVRAPLSSSTAVAVAPLVAKVHTTMIAGIQPTRAIAANHRGATPATMQQPRQQGRAISAHSAAAAAVPILRSLSHPWSAGLLPQPAVVPSFPPSLFFLPPMLSGQKRARTARSQFRSQSQQQPQSIDGTSGGSAGMQPDRTAVPLSSQLIHPPIQSLSNAIATAPSDVAARPLPSVSMPTSSPPAFVPASASLSASVPAASLASCIKIPHPACQQIVLAALSFLQCQSPPSPVSLRSASSAAFASASASAAVVARASFLPLHAHLRSLFPADLPVLLSRCAQHACFIHERGWEEYERSFIRAEPCSKQLASNNSDSSDNTTQATHIPQQPQQRQHQQTQQPQQTQPARTSQVTHAGAVEAISIAQRFSAPACVQAH